MKISFCREIFYLMVRIVKITWDFLRGLWAMRNIEQPMVTILGGLRVKAEDPYSTQAFEVAKALAQNGFSIITGGGKGIMVAANCGAANAGPTKDKRNCKTLGIGLTHINHGFENPCAKVYKANYFFIRKWFLFRYSVGFVFFPGGLGTVDELFELLNLIVFGMTDPQFIILIDKNYWKPMIDWYVNTAMKHDFITLAPHEVFIIVETPQEALESILRNRANRPSHHKQYQ